MVNAPRIPLTLLWIAVLVVLASLSVFYGYTSYRANAINVGMHEGTIEEFGRWMDLGSKLLIPTLLLWGVALALSLDRYLVDLLDRRKHRLFGVLLLTLVAPPILVLGAVSWF